MISTDLDCDYWVGFLGAGGSFLGTGVSDDLDRTSKP